MDSNTTQLPGQSSHKTTSELVTPCIKRKVWWQSHSRTRTRPISPRSFRSPPSTELDTEGIGHQIKYTPTGWQGPQPWEEAPSGWAGPAEAPA